MERSYSTPERMRQQQEQQENQIVVALGRVPRADAYFHPKFAPFSHASTQGKEKIITHGFVPKEIIKHG